MPENQIVQKNHIEKIAQKAVMDSQDLDCSLTTAVTKLALEHGLNPYEWEHVCHRVNHIVFKNKYAEDKLTAFNIANHKDVASGIHPQEKVAISYVETQPDTMVVKGHPKIDTEPIPPEVAMGRELREGSNMAEAGERNADILNSLNLKRDKVYDQIYNTIRSLIQSGETLENIHEVLLNSWGSHNEKDITSIFSEIVERLKSEGYLSQNTEYKGIDKNRLPDRMPVENELTKSAAQLIKVNEDAISHGLAHLKFMYILKEAGFPKKAETLKNRVRHNVIDDLIEEYVGQDTYMKTGDLSSAIKKVKDMPKGTPWKKMVTEGWTKALPLLMGYAAIYGAGEVYNYAKTKVMKEKLKKNYPELAKIKPKTYSDVFDTLVALNPGLLKTPFALSSLITKHSIMGVIDTPTIQSLSGGRPKPTLSTELTKAILQATMPPRKTITEHVYPGKEV